MAAPGGLYEPLFGERDVAACLSDQARLQAMLDVEVALAEALARAGVVPAGSVEPIRQVARAQLYDPATLATEAARAGNVVIPLVADLTRRATAIDPVAGRYVHWGATSQDIVDTGLVLQVRAASAPLLHQFERAARAAAAHARQHRNTPVAGRTWLQHATPTTFGLKAAGWLDALERVRHAVESAFSSSFVLQFGGASGTLAALGPAALDVASALAERLDLKLPPAPWHGHRDRLAQLACALGVATGTLGKIARDLALLAQTEVAEARPGKTAGGSSTMPHKRNPVSCAVALAAAVRVPGLVANMLAGMPQEHERGLGGWHAEWDVLPEIVLLTAGAARSVADALEDLTVDAARMRANMEITRGLAQAEAVAMTLGRDLGKHEAHALVEAASRRAAAEERPLADVLAEDAAVARVLTRDALEQCLSPEAYLGVADAFVDRILATWKRAEGPDA
jgi:3-carboxy-cis,cis-muconate cycloisomerase